MDHLFRSKPTYQSIVDKQRAAQHWLAHGTTRTGPELALYKRTLEPVPLSDLELPKLPLVRSRSPDVQGRFVVLGEVAQIPGKVMLIDIDTGEVRVHFTSDQLELIPPS